MDQIHLHSRHLHLQQPHHPHPAPPSHSMMIDVSTSSDSRLPQWSVQETKEFVAIRAELDQNFMETKRNKQLWEVISNAMKDKGYHRSAEQCKCKWKNLVTRYKGCETGEPESMRQQFPFYSELQAIFTARMQKMVWAEAEGGGRRRKKAAMNVSSDEEDDNDNDEDISMEGEKINSRKKMKKGKMIGSRSNNSTGGGEGNNNNNSRSSNGLREIVEELMRQQMQMESQWMEAFEVREKERKEREREWRQTMEALENERMMMDQRWREREEQRRVREEARAERRDALITALLNKLTRQEMMKQ